MAVDAKKGKVYTKYARMIEIAARDGGDPSSNVRLRTLIDAAKAESVPNANIDRAIKKGSGALGGEQMQEILYEGYGPEGSAFVIECLSDNRNRVLSNVKNILSKHGGRFAETGSVLWMFDRKGVVIAVVPEEDLLSTKSHLQDPVKRDTLELQLIDLGAEDVVIEDAAIHITTSISHWQGVRDVLQKLGFTIDTAELQYIPKQTAPVTSDAMTTVEKLIEFLEADDDVSTVYTNARSIV